VSESTRALFAAHPPPKGVMNLFGQMRLYDLLSEYGREQTDVVANRFGMDRPQFVKQANGALRRWGNMKPPLLLPPKVSSADMR